MILTVSTIVLMVLAILSLLLAFYGGYIALSIMDEKYGNESVSQLVEQRYYLLGIIGLIVLGARLIAAPLFFWMLQSLVPYCPGAMCASGVVNVSEPFSWIDMTLKLVVPVMYGLWIVIETANRRSKKLPMVNLLAKSFALVLLPVLVIETALDIILVSSIQPTYAPCCSSVYDVEPPFSPSSFFGPGVSALIIGSTVIASVVVISVQLFNISSKKRFLVVIGLSPFLGILYLTAIHDSLAPAVLGLPNHHCPYCLFQEFPDTAIFAALFWIGVAMAVWNVVLDYLWLKRGLQINQVESILGHLRKVSVVAIIFSLTSLLSHLAIAW